MTGGADGSDGDGDDSTDDRNRSSGGIRFWLPPIRLPPLFPADFRPRFVPPERVRTPGNLLLAAVALDVIDAAVLLAVGGGWARVLVGTVLALVLLGRVGLAYGWEAVVPLVGSPLPGLVPTATLLALGVGPDPEHD